MYRPKKKKLIRRGAVATVVTFAAVATIGLSTIIHRNDPVAASVNAPHTAGATAAQTAVVSSSLRGTGSFTTPAKYHLVDSSDHASSSGDN